MNLLKRSPPPSSQQQQHPAAGGAAASAPPPAPSQSSSARLGSGEKSAFRTVERPQKPSAFRAISQLLASDDEGPGRQQPPLTQHRPTRDDEDEDEEIQVQDSPGAWRERWLEQQPLELTKHDR